MWLTLDLLKSDVKTHQCWCMLGKLLDLTCSTWPQWMYIFLDGTRISQMEIHLWKKYCRWYRWLTKLESPSLAIIIPMILLFLHIANGESWRRHPSGYLILHYMSAWNSPKATHIYTVSITLFKVLCEIF